MKSLLISCDYDGTIVIHDFPEIGEPLPHVWRVLKRIQASGHRLILNTCRENSNKRQYLDEAVQHCRANGIKFVSINENRPEDDFRENAKIRRKVYANIMIDDRNFGGFPGWLAVEKYLEKEGLLND